MGGEVKIVKFDFDLFFLSGAKVLVMMKEIGSK
jgi:hypothetical protein